MMMTDNLLQIRAPGINFYVLRDSSGLYLIDCGFIGGRRLLQRGLNKRGWSREKIVGIIITHGHLDHILNVSRIAQESGAWIAAPHQDQAHYRGCAKYSGISKVTGALECVGKPLLGFHPFTPTRLLSDGDHLDVWGGLTTVHLPGHTAGHCGFYSQQSKLLFCADLFASYGSFSHLPPRLFNHQENIIPSSINKALDLDLKGVLPNHCDTSSPQIHLARLIALNKKLSTQNPISSDASSGEGRN